MVENVIIGGGISGLSAAYYLKSQGRDFKLLEKSSSCGGVMHTYFDRKNVWDVGPVSFHLTEEIREIVEALGIDDELVYASQKSNSRFIYRRNRLHKLTSSPFSLFKSNVLSIKGRFRVLKETRISSKSSPEETVAEFVTRRFGKEAYETLANAILGGIYGGEPSQMEVSSVLKKFVEYEAEYGSVIKGLNSNKGGPKRTITSFKKGNETLITALTEYSKSEIEVNQMVTKISKLPEGYRIDLRSQESIIAKNVFLTCPAHITAQFIDEIDPNLGESLKSIRYNTMDVTHLTYDINQVQKGIEGFGFLIPKVEQKPLLGAVINSSIFERSEEQNEISLSVFSTQDRGHSTSEAQQFIETLLKIEGAPKFEKHWSWDKAIPQFDLGYGQVLNQIKVFEKAENITIAGNFRSGVSVGDCVRFSKESFS